MSVIKDGSKVIIRKDTFLRSQDVCRGKKVTFHKLHFFLDNAVGCPYGTTFEVKDSHLFDKTSCDSNVSQSKPITTSGDNNQLINDDGNSQKLSRDDIMALKADGVTGEKIIDQLIKNSDSFDKKTEFSQAKYLKKKKKRHITEVTILKPTLPLICEMLHVNIAGKILNLRMDSVSQILTMANIKSNTNVLLMESTQSFLAGVILHRMGGLGNLVQIYCGGFPVRLCLDYFDLEKKDKEILNGFPMSKIHTLTSLGLAQKDSSKASDDITGQSKKTPMMIGEEMEDDKDYDNREGKQLTKEEKANRTENRNYENEKALQLLNKRSMDSLIIATKFRSKTTVLKLIEFLAPSRPLVIYSPYKEILVECYTALKELKNVVLLNLTETWWRSYQVLPERTHPQITINGTGGYLLTGIKVDNESPPDIDDSIIDLTHSPAKKMKIE